MLSACIPLRAALRLLQMIVYYSPWMHRPSVSEREPQGWIINWMMDRLAFFNERIIEIQFSKKNCRSHHQAALAKVFGVYN